MIEFCRSGAASGVRRGGGHQEDSLVTAGGNAKPKTKGLTPAQLAKIEQSAHEALHKFIDEMSIAKYLEKSTGDETLEWHSLAETFPEKTLDVLIGELHGDGGSHKNGQITYRTAKKVGADFEIK
jgi:hypothetical protein